MTALPKVLGWLGAVLLVACGGGDGAELAALRSEVERLQSGPIATPEPTVETETIEGTVTILQREGWGATGGGSCEGDSGFDDIGPGHQARVTSSDGTVLAAGPLRTGEIDATRARCVVPFAIEDVPASDLYNIEVSDRGALTYTYEEMQATGWTVGFELDP